MIATSLAPSTLDSWLKAYPSLPGLLIALVCLLVLFRVLWPRFKSAGRGKGRPVMDPVQVEQLLTGGGALVVDLRSPDAFKTGHIRGCMHVPFHELNARFVAPDPKAKRAMILVDETDELSHQAFDQLTARGFSWLYVMQGGMKAWRSANRPITK
jgi:rhodanese-related sulfurtransferase